MGKKHTCVIEISDYDFDDLKNAVSKNCEMTQLFWPQEISRAVYSIAKDYLSAMSEKTAEEQVDYTVSMFAWALFIGICMGAGKKTKLTRYDEGQIC